MVFSLALLLAAAAVCDIRTHRIPNGLIVSGLVVGLAGHLFLGGGWSLLESLAGMAAALPLVILYSMRALGAGDVKLLMTVGALMGPHFLLWTLLGTVFAGGLLALLWLARFSRAGRMPFAPAIALGAVGAFVHLHLRLL